MLTRQSLATYQANYHNNHNFDADKDLAKAIQAAAVETGLTVHDGLIVTGDQFINSQEAIDHIHSIYPAALASEMEGAAIGQVATEFHTPLL